MAAEDPTDQNGVDCLIMHSFASYSHHPDLLDLQKIHIVNQDSTVLGENDDYRFAAKENEASSIRVVEFVSDSDSPFEEQSHDHRCLLRLERI